MKVAHLRCGSDIRDGLSQAGLDGDFIEFSDPVCQGPVPQTADEAELQSLRAAFLSADYGAGTPEQCRHRLEREGHAVKALGRYDRVLLWFEHDLYDQTVLIRLLDRVADFPDLDDRLFLIAIDRFPGIPRFVGLGQLTPDQLATLPSTAKPVTAGQKALARRAWHAYRAATPADLWRLAVAGTGDLPLLGDALRRHLMDLPWTTDGLSLTERLSLQAVAQGAATPGQVFAALSRHLEPQPFLGDLMFWPVLRRLARADSPAITPFDSWATPIALADLGEALLAGSADWCRANGVERWLGGMHLAGRRPPWRWDPNAARPVQAS